MHDGVVGAQQVVGREPPVEYGKQPVVRGNLFVDVAAPHQSVDTLGGEALERVAAAVHAQIRIQSFAEPRELIPAHVVVDDREAVLVEPREVGLHIEAGQLPTRPRDIFAHPLPRRSVTFCLRAPPFCPPAIPVMSIIAACARLRRGSGDTIGRTQSNGESRRVPAARTGQHQLALMLPKRPFHDSDCKWIERVIIGLLRSFSKAGSSCRSQDHYKIVSGLDVGAESFAHDRRSCGLTCVCQDGDRRRAMLSTVAAQAAAASAPLTTKWSWKNFLCSSCSWKFCGVRTADMTGTLVSS